MIIVCNLPISFVDFKADPSIHLYALDEDRFVMSENCESLFEEEEKDPLYFDLIANQPHKFFKRDQNQYQLAVYEPGSKQLYIQLYNKKVLKLSTGPLTALE